jgi:hypothetical protein
MREIGAPFPRVRKRRSPTIPVLRRVLALSHSRVLLASAWPSNPRTPPASGKCGLCGKMLHGLLWLTDAPAPGQKPCRVLQLAARMWDDRR